MSSVTGETTADAVVNRCCAAVQVVEPTQVISTAGLCLGGCMRRTYLVEQNLEALALVFVHHYPLCYPLLDVCDGRGLFSSKKHAL